MGKIYIITEAWGSVVEADKTGRREEGKETIRDGEFGTEAQRRTWMFTMGRGR